MRPTYADLSLLIDAPRSPTARRACRCSARSPASRWRSCCGAARLAGLGAARLTRSRHPMTDVNRRVLPGFSLSLGYTLLYLSLLVLIPLAACFLKASSLRSTQFVAAVWTPRARAAYGLTLGTSFVAALINVLLGVLVAWVLVRYEFPLQAAVRRRWSTCRSRCRRRSPAWSTRASTSQNGWLGQFLVPLGIEGAYSRLGHRAGADLHRLPVRRAHGAAGARGPRGRDRGGGGLPRRHPLADVLARDPADRCCRR